MACRNARGVPLSQRSRPYPANTVECPNCSGDGVVNGTCHCGRCESPPDETCPVCDGRGYVDGPVCQECGEPLPDDDGRTDPRSCQDCNERGIELAVAKASTDLAAIHSMLKGECARCGQPSVDEVCGSCAGDVVHERLL